MKHICICLVASVILLNALACSGPSESVSATKPAQVNVTTDQDRSKPGEPIGISVQNNLDIPIWYAKHVDCGLSFWGLETCTGAKVSHRMPCEWVAPQHDFTLLEPGETLTGEWNGAVEDREGSKPAKPGCYVISVPYFTSEPEPSGAHWAETVQTAYSQRLTVK
jgi:hypothetical protein